MVGSGREKMASPSGSPPSVVTKWRWKAEALLRLHNLIALPLTLTMNMMMELRMMFSEFRNQD